MAYLGRKSAAAALVTGDIPDDSITSAKIVAGTVAASDVAADVATQAELDTVSTVASAALPKAGGAMTGAITTNSTFDGIDIATRDAVLTSTTTTAGAALPKAGGTMSGNLTIDATGTIASLRIDTDSPATDKPARIVFATSATANYYNAAIGGIRDVADNGSGAVVFYTGSAAETTDGNLTERMRITSGGRVGIGVAPSNSALRVKQGSSNQFAIQVSHDGGGSVQRAYSAYFDYAPNDTTAKFCEFGDSGDTRFYVYSNGNVTNANDSYGGTSDERIKQDIRDANSQWDDIKAIRVVKFKKKSDVTQYGEDKAWEHIGTIAQEVELVSPKLVEESPPSSFELENCGFGEQNEDGEWVVKQDEDGNDMKVKSMKYSILHMKAVKALQEAMSRIEILEAKVTALESA